MRNSITGITQITDIIKVVYQNQIDHFFQLKRYRVQTIWIFLENAGGGWVADEEKKGLLLFLSLMKIYHLLLIP